MGTKRAWKTVGASPMKPAGRRSRESWPTRRSAVPGLRADLVGLTRRAPTQAARQASTRGAKRNHFAQFGNTHNNHWPGLARNAALPRAWGTLKQQFSRKKRKEAKEFEGFTQTRTLICRVNGGCFRTFLSAFFVLFGHPSAGSKMTDSRSLQFRGCSRFRHPYAILRHGRWPICAPYA